jgi:hypothetical protein
MGFCASGGVLILSNCGFEDLRSGEATQNGP